MAVTVNLQDRMSEAWHKLEGRYAAYRLIVPGEPSFVCLPAQCGAQCCRAFSVSLGEAEVGRMVSASGLTPSRFLESEDGEPIALPLVQPYLLARSDGGCSLLDTRLTCSQYAGRPDACRLYPHFVVFLEENAARPSRPTDLAGMARSVRAVLAGEAGRPYLPLLLGHRECPGFTGPPLTAEAWLATLRTTARTQYFPEAGDDWPGP